VKDVLVAWGNQNPEAPNRSYWDMGILDALVDRSLWRTPGGPRYVSVDGIPADADGAVVIIPGTQNPDPDVINAAIKHLRWVLLIITGDEEGLLPHERLSHPNITCWTSTPRPGRHVGWRGLGFGWPSGIREALAKDCGARIYDWFFSGQVTHERRHQCAAVMRTMSGGQLHETLGFAQGVAQADYWRGLASSKIAPCPGGPVTPDSFRLFEALEAGCIPIADEASGRGQEPGYWQRIFGEKIPFPIINDWSTSPDVTRELLANWPRNANKVFSFWQAHKRKLAYALDADVQLLSGIEQHRDQVSDLLTVLIPTSPIPSHPSTDIIEETVESIRAQDELRDCEILIMCDGVREEQTVMEWKYQEYVRQLLWLANTKWKNVLPIVFDEHSHQGLMTRATLKDVRTPLMMFVEHDTPLIGQTDWRGIANAVLSGEANVVRFHHEASVLEPHKYLMLDEEPRMVAGVPLLRTVQWSQRPHVASTEFYRWLINTHFGERSRTMIEDLVYGVLETHYREEGLAGWDKFRLWMYAPPGDIKRSTHTDGRGGEPKYAMDFQYDGDVPKWAPTPGRRE